MADGGREGKREDWMRECRDWCKKGTKLRGGSKEVKGMGIKSGEGEMGCKGAEGNVFLAVRGVGGVRVNKKVNQCRRTEGVGVHKGEGGE